MLSPKKVKYRKPQKGKNKGLANKWREQHNFDIHDTLVFDGDLIDSVNCNWIHFKHQSA